MEMNFLSSQLPRHYGRVFFRRKGELPSLDMSAD